MRSTHRGLLIGFIIMSNMYSREYMVMMITEQFDELITIKLIAASIFGLLFVAIPDEGD